MKRLTARPHHVGSAYDRENAEFLVSLFGSFGFETRIEEFTVLFPVPKTRVLEMVAPSRFTASLDEPALAEDATSGQKDEQLPVYNAYSIDGDVTAEVVYVNYGVPKDYEELAERGVDVKGQIVLARYGGSWRGIKPKVAVEHGAVGCLIYSDPRDDGYFQGDEYPKGAFRSESGAQRGSVADMPVFPGDPLTPGVGATKDAEAPRPEGRADAHEDPRPADLVGRRAAVPEGALGSRRTRGVARRAARHVPPRARPREGAPEGRVRLADGARCATSSRC